MKKKIISVLLAIIVLVLAFALVGCSDLEEIFNDSTNTYNDDGNNGNSYNGGNQGAHVVTIDDLQLLARDDANYTVSVSGEMYEQIFGRDGFQTMAYSNNKCYFHGTTADAEDQYETEVYGKKIDGTFRYYMRVAQVPQSLADSDWSESAEVGMTIQGMREGLANIKYNEIKEVGDHYEYTDPDSGMTAVIVIEGNSIVMTMTSEDGRLGYYTISKIGTTTITLPDTLPAEVLEGENDPNGNDPNGNNQNGNDPANPGGNGAQGGGSGSSGSGSVSGGNGGQSHVVTIDDLQLITQEGANYSFSVSGPYYEDFLGQGGVFEMKSTANTFYLHFTILDYGSLYEIQVYGKKMNGAFRYVFNLAGNGAGDPGWEEISWTAIRDMRSQFAEINFEDIVAVGDHYEYTDPNDGATAVITVANGRIMMITTLDGLSGTLVLSDIGTTTITLPDTLPAEMLEPDPEPEQDPIVDPEPQDEDPIVNPDPEPQQGGGNGGNNGSQPSGAGYTINDVSRLAEGNFTESAAVTGDNGTQQATFYVTREGIYYDFSYDSGYMDFDEEDWESELGLYPAFYDPSSYVRDGDHYRYTNGAIVEDGVRVTVNSLRVNSDSLVFNLTLLYSGDGYNFTVTEVVTFTNIGTTVLP